MCYTYLILVMVYEVNNVFSSYFKKLELSERIGNFSKVTQLKCSKSVNQALPMKLQGIYF